MSRSVKALVRLLLLAFVAVCLVSCSVTRRVPEGGLLLDRVVLDGDLGGQSDLVSYVRQQPNTRFIGLWRISLGLYSMVGDSARTGFGGWLERVGQEPVVYDSLLSVRSSQQLRLFLVSRGFYDAQVSDSLVVTGRKRCKVIYKVQAGRVYRLNSLSYDVPDGEVGELVLSDTARSLIKAGDPFDSNVLDLERERITQRLRESGYYSFGKDYVFFKVDTKGLDHAMNATLVVANAIGGADMRTPVPHRKAIVDSLTFIVETPSVAGNDSAARRTMQVDSAIVMRFRGSRPPFTRTLVASSSFVVPGRLFRLSDGDLMRSRLLSLKAIRQASVYFSEPDSVSADSLTHLRCITRIETAPRQSFGFDVEGTNSSGNLGAALNIRYAHANIFRGAEALAVKGRLATQHQSAVGGKRDFYTLETGVETTLTFPFMMMPGASLHFYKNHNPKTLFSVSFDYQRRPEFTRNVLSTRMTYNWRGSAYASHSLTPVEFNIVRIPSIATSFAEYIRGTYLQYSYTDHFIMSLGYQFTFNQQTVLRNQSGVFFRFGLETAGNVLNLLTQRQEPEVDFKKVWSIRFAQYVKTDAELRYQSSDMWGNMYVARLFAGVGVPYGNSVMLPYEKSYFVGGANSIRAWPVRGLGPGAKRADSSLRYHNQTGDIRLEANAEYRFKIISVLEGAAFADAGNIWMLNKDYNDPLSVFTSKFFKQLALGAGLGFRLNFNYFILRVDAAYKLRDPAAEGRRWVVRNRFDPGEIAWNFAIGYPF